MKRIMVLAGLLPLVMSVAAWAGYGSWEEKYLIPGNYNNSFLDVAAFDPTNVFMVGVWTDSISTFKFVWRTGDGGETVQNVYSWTMNPYLICEMLKITDARTSVAYPRANLVLLGGSGVSQDCMDKFGPDMAQQMICLFVCAMTIGPSIWYTEDNGATYQDATLAEWNQEDYPTIQSISMVDENVGMAGGLGSYVIKTSDGGYTWAKTASLPASGQYVNRVFCLNENTCWLAIGEWDPDADAKDLNELEGLDQVQAHYHRMMLSSNPMYRHEYWKSLDGGKSTKMLNGAIYKTTDGGASWVTQKETPQIGYDNVHFVDANNGWVYGEQYTPEGGIVYLYRTTDGGDTWVDVTDHFPATIEGLQGWVPFGVKFINPGFGIAYGYGAKMLKYTPVFLWTEDGGENWTVDTSVLDLSAGQFAFAWVSPTVAYSVGLYLNLMRYTGENLSPPVADAGDDFETVVGQEANLDGSGSYDPDGGGVFYAWSQVSGPSIELSDPTLAKPTFTPTEVGSAVFQLVVNDGELSSDPDTVTVTIVPPADDDDDITDDDSADDDAADDDDDDDDDTNVSGDDDNDDDDNDESSGCGC